MTDKKFFADGAVTLVGGGAVGNGDLRLALSYAPTLVAADGGAGVALSAGQMPAAVIGDFDSLSDADRAMIPPERLFHISEQDSTDFDKALSRIDAPLVLAVGFLGGRVDHQLAAFNSLVRRPELPCILIGALEVAFLLPPRIRLQLRAGDIVSLFPFSRVSGQSTGLEWPIDGLVFDPDGRVGTSNRAEGSVEIQTDNAGLVALVPRARLGETIQGFGAIAGLDTPEKPF